MNTAVVVRAVLLLGVFAVTDARRLLRARAASGAEPEVEADKKPSESKSLHEAEHAQASRMETADGTHPQTCHNLFAYEDSVKMCLSLQELICGKSCDLVMQDDKNCPEMQKLLCVHPPMPEAEKSVKIEPTLPPPDEKTAHVTFCNAYPSQVDVNIHHDKYYTLPDPVVVEDLGYMQCVQFQANGEEELIFSVGNHSKGFHVMGDEVNHLVLVGQFDVGKKEIGFRHFGWKDEGFGRPILCNAYPGNEPGRFFMDGTPNYPFSNPANTVGHLGYMECDLMALDKKELQVAPMKMGVKFASGKSLTFEVTAASTLFMIGDDTARHEPRMRDYHYANLKNALDDEENGRRFFVPHYPEKLGHPPLSAA